MTITMEYPTITRVYRVAVRIGEHYITLEEQIRLPTDASDAEIAQAVGLGERIYHAQQAAIQAQVARLFDAHQQLATTSPPPSPPVILEPEAPATQRQRALIDRLAQSLEWTIDDLERFAREYQIEFSTLTKGEASRLIDVLKQLRPGGSIVATNQT